MVVVLVFSLVEHCGLFNRGTQSLTDLFGLLKFSSATIAALLHHIFSSPHIFSPSYAPAPLPPMPFCPSWVGWVTLSPTDRCEARWCPLCLWIMNRFCLKQQLWWWDFNTRKTAVWLIHEDVNKLEETRWLCQNFPWWDLHEHSLWLLFEGN